MALPAPNPPNELSSRTVKEIRVGLDLGQQRLSGRFPSNTPLWDILIDFQQKENVMLTSFQDPMGNWYLPVLSVRNTTADSLFLLLHTFKQLGVSTKGGVLLSVEFRPAGFPIDLLPENLERAREELLEAFPPTPPPTETEPMDIEEEEEEETKRKSLYPDLSPEANQDDVSPEFSTMLGTASRRLYELLSSIPTQSDWEIAKKTTKTIIKNLKKPDEKFQKFKADHPKINDRLMRWENAQSFFLAVGFEPEEGGFLHFQQQLSDEETEIFIDRLLRGIENSHFVPAVQPIPEVNISMKVWTRDNLRDVKRAYAESQRTKARSATGVVNDALRTLKAKREYLHPSEFMTQKQRKHKAGLIDRVYASTMIHVEFPSGLILEGHFHPKDKIGKLRGYVYNSLRQEAQPFPFQLKLPPARILKDDDKTFKEAGLVPAGIVRFQGEITRELETVLQEEIIEMVDQSEYSPVPTALNAQKATKVVRQKKKNALARNLLKIGR